MLSNASSLATFRFDTGENEPAKNLQTFVKICRNLQILLIFLTSCPKVRTRGIPTKPMAVGPDKGKMCINPKKVDYCADIRATNFPPPPEAQPVEAPRKAAKMSPDHFFPSGDAVLS